MARSTWALCCEAGAVAENTAHAETDAGQRGALHVRDKVVDRIAAHAATTTSGVVPHSSGLDRVTGRDLPRVETTVAGGHVRARVHIAAAWPPVLPDTAAAVRAHVTEQLRTLAGLTVDAVDVAVTAVVHDTTSSSTTRSVQ